MMDYRQILEGMAYGNYGQSRAGWERSWDGHPGWESWRVGYEERLRETERRAIVKEISTKYEGEYAKLVADAFSPYRGSLAFEGVEVGFAKPEPVEGYGNYRARRAGLVKMRPSNDYQLRFVHDEWAQLIAHLRSFPEHGEELHEYAGRIQRAWRRRRARRLGGAFAIQAWLTDSLGLINSTNKRLEG